jgi:hypothetical protein
LLLLNHWLHQRRAGATTVVLSLRRFTRGRKNRLALILLLMGLCTFTVTPPVAPAHAQTAPTAVEQPVILLPITGALSERAGEFSGMDWYGDTLIVLPQFPWVFDQHLLALPKQAIVDVITGASTAPLQANLVPLLGGEALEALPGFEGYEAIAFAGERAYLTVETMAGKEMLGYVTTGVMAPDLSGLRLYPTVRTPIEAQTVLNNMTDEALVIDGDEVLTFYEVNGRLINWWPAVHRFDADTLQPLGTRPMTYLDFRLTDATPLDGERRFWVINYFYPGDRLGLGVDALARRYGIGPTHRTHAAVERLVQLELTAEGVTLLPRAPIQLQLTEAEGRNWEGIVRLETPTIAGFLLVTDRNPQTLFAFVPDP